MKIYTNSYLPAINSINIECYAKQKPIYGKHGNQIGSFYGRIEKGISVDCNNEPAAGYLAIPITQEACVRCEQGGWNALPTFDDNKKRKKVMAYDASYEDDALEEINRVLNNVKKLNSLATQPFGLQINTTNTNIPIIVDLNIIVSNKVVEVAFDDGTSTKAVCDDTDIFSLQEAINVCYLKKLLGGSGAYNKMIRSAIKIYENKLKAKEYEAAELARKERKRAKKAEKRRLRQERIEAQKREEAIQIQTDAYLRAIKALEEEFDNG